MMKTKERNTSQMIAQLTGVQVAAVLSELDRLSSRALSCHLSSGCDVDRPARMAITSSRLLGRRPTSDIINVICWPTEDGGERIVVNLK